MKHEQAELTTTVPKMVEGGAAEPKPSIVRFGFLIPVLDAFVDVIEPAIRWFSRGKRFVAVEIDDEDFAFYRLSGDRATLVGRASTLAERERRNLRIKPPRDVELRLHAESVILTTLKIPAEGLAYIEQIVESRLDRLTPWKPDKLLYGYDAAAKPGADGRIDVNFAATSRDIGASGIARLGAFGMNPSRIGSAAEPIEQRLRIDLLRGESDTTRQRMRRRAGACAISVFLVILLAFAVSAYFAFASSQRIAALDDALATTRNLLVRGSGTTANGERETALLQAKTTQNARFMMIDRLATIIPDNTFLDELDIEKNGIRIAGTSTEASALIEILSLEPSFADAKFVAPVTRQDDGRDRFDITATAAAQGQPAAVVP